MNKDLELNVVDLIKKIYGLKSEIDKFHPLPKEVEDRIFQKYRLEWNYNSNAIEGNSLNYGETYAFLMHGITAHGKPLKDYLDIKGHNEAINYLINLVRNKEELTEAVIRELHKVILVESYETDAVTQNGKLTKKTVTLGAYKTVPNHVKTATGEMHYFASPEETPAKMHDLITWYRKTKNDKEIHPVVLAAFFHHHFSEIHPFDDGNGRLARLLMNLILMQNNFPPAIIKTKDRNNYYLALSQADSGDTKKFVEYVAEVLIHSMEIYLKGACGESIDEPDDLDKEIELIKREIQSSPEKIEIKKNAEVIESFYRGSLKSSLKQINKEMKKFADLFLSYNFYEFFPDKNGYKRRRDFQKITSTFRPNELYSVLPHVRNTTLLCCEFKEFKSAKNPFTVEVLILIVFDDFDYQIKLGIKNVISFHFKDILSVVNNKPPLFKNYYHQQISDQQITLLVNELKKEVIDFIKKKQNGSKIE